MENHSLPADKKRNLITKADDQTDPKYGKAPEERTIEEQFIYGIINLDKPSGPTSHEVAAWVRKILEIKKTGHGGTLDPKVTGILPVALQEGTKILQSLLLAGKEYVCIMKLHQEVPENKIRNVCNEFVGEIYQRPPIRASVKRRLRTRKIYYLDVLEIAEKNVLMRVGCQAGTYIRKICSDIGEALKVGAHMAELRRTRTACFKEDETLTTLHDLKDGYIFWKEDLEEKYLKKMILPIEQGISHLAKVVIRDSAIDAICHGASLAAPGILKVDTGIKKKELVAILSLKGELIALGRSLKTTSEILKIDHGILIKTERVIMNKRTYPSWNEYK
ncbi:MAG: RNA-guided pseudouridylation complex pseudouridine synthase subunit Cbf5 [Candidatus Lokiarchaeota archaeon]|nr:RNA-guided pseudouridylation complex pseudouridine synthase subunit Cbf5 [Candidatus Lokiarchaeota archaeon]